MFRMKAGSIGEMPPSTRGSVGFALRMAFPAASSLVAAVALLLAFLSDGTTQYLLLVLFGFTSPMYVAGGSAVTQDVVHPGLRAMSLSINVIVQHVLGSSLGPVFVGAVSDRYDIITALSVLPAFSLLAGLLFFIGSFFYEEEAARVEKAAPSMP